MLHKQQNFNKSGMVGKTGLAKKSSDGFFGR